MSAPPPSPPPNPDDGWGYVIAEQRRRERAEFEAAHRSGALARSPSTKRLGRSWWCTSSEEAERRALEDCQSTDAVLLMSGYGTKIVLIEGGSGAYWCQPGLSAQHAMEVAFIECHKMDPDCQLRVVLDTAAGDETAYWLQRQHEQFKFPAGAEVSRDRRFWRNDQRREWVPIPKSDDGRISLERTGDYESPWVR